MIPKFREFDRERHRTDYQKGMSYGEQLIIYRTQNDDVDAPVDFDIQDHIHLNDLKAEVSD